VLDQRNAPASMDKGISMMGRKFRMIVIHGIYIFLNKDISLL
jgi:hypothetical protein